MPIDTSVIYNGGASIGANLGAAITRLSERQEKEKEQAKMEKRLFDSYVTQGEALGLDTNRLKTMSLGEVSGAVEGLKQKKIMAAQDQEAQIRAAQIKQYLAQADERESLAGFNRDVATATTPRIDPAQLGSAAEDFGQSAAAMDPVAMGQQLKRYLGAAEPTAPTLSPAMIQRLAASNGVLQNPQVQNMAELAARYGAKQTPFDPSIKTLRTNVGGREIEVPMVTTSPNSAQALPGMSPDDRRYNRPEAPTWEEQMKTMPDRPGFFPAPNGKGGIIWLKKDPNDDLSSGIETDKEVLAKLKSMKARGVKEAKISGAGNDQVEEGGVFTFGEKNIDDLIAGLETKISGSGGKPAARAKQSSETDEVRPLPSKASELVKGRVYNTSKGPAQWDGEHFVK